MECLSVSVNNMDRDAPRIDETPILFTVVGFPVSSPQAVVPALRDFVPDFRMRVAVDIQSELVAGVPRPSQLGSVVPVFRCLKILG